MADDKDKKVVGGISGLSVIIGLMVLLSFWLVNNGPNGINNRPKTITPSSPRSQSVPSKKIDNYIDKITGQEKKYSSYHGQVSLQVSSVYTDNPNQEYITLSVHGNQNPINIGGWTLKNGREKKTYIVSGNAVRGQSVSVKIPNEGVILYNPFNPSTNIHSPIKLKSGERAIVVTGNIPTLSTVAIRENFKINRCLGYLEDRSVDQRGSSYRFSPSLRYNCPSNHDLPSIDELDEICYNFVRSISGCHQPTDIYDNKNGYCLDRNCNLSNFCRTFVKQNFNPQTCYQLYSSGKDFIGPEWRIYLHRTWELWDRQRETISLYDTKGLLVAEISY